MKDRVPLAQWPVSVQWPAIRELVDCGLIATPLSAKMIADWPDAWDDLSQHARLLWAKRAAISNDYLSQSDAA